jgi:hypothetical protein
MHVLFSHPIGSDGWEFSGQGEDCVALPRGFWTADALSSCACFACGVLGGFGVGIFVILGGVGRGCFRNRLMVR